ncbi:fluoride efflux transporter FluC [Actinomyces oris]|uniref:fluoride efflux transporter FluC n=1 Tax=Actinomyces oris TaxID=544580 RepID=UPI0022FD562D|nr:CrcB family protein [Actinomyces oris]WCA43860.1 CrcB family protein [Actinomyces oris]
MAEADPGAGTRGSSEAGGDSAPGAVARPGAGPGTEPGAGPGAEPAPTVAVSPSAAGRAPSVAASLAPSMAASPSADGSPPAAGRAPSVTASLALVTAGGCAGTLVRAALERAWPASPGHLPVTTLALNVVGALALGLLLGALGEGRPRLRLALGTGVLGGLTTHSTFILESHRLLTPGGDGGHPVLGTAYLVGSMVAGLVAAGLGLWLAGRLRRLGCTGGTGSVGRAGRASRAGRGPLPEGS